MLQMLKVRFRSSRTPSRKRYVKVSVMYHNFFVSSSSLTSQKKTPQSLARRHIAVVPEIWLEEAKIEKQLTETLHMSSLKTPSKRI